jgi:hypothetical protein
MPGNVSPGRHALRRWREKAAIFEAEGYAKE